MALLLLAYVIVAFVAGVIALAMPCCFSVLLPSYFAQSFRHKTRRLGMTIVFAAGIGTVMLPLALGMVTIAQSITASHSVVFVAGGFLMILLGFLTLWGEGMLPQLNLPVNLNKNDAPSVYVLGLFSGAATTCCAPVLAGVMILSALSASLLEGLLVGFTYVAGMVAPLFVIALIWDKYALQGENILRGRILRMNYFGREFSIHSTKLVAGTMFVAMGLATAALGLMGRMIPMPGSAVVGVVQSQFARTLVKFFADVEPIETMAAVAGIVLILGCAILARKHLRNATADIARARNSKSEP